MIDTHAHITNDTLFPLRESLIQRAKDNGIESIVCITTNDIELERALLLKEEHPIISVAAFQLPHAAHLEKAFTSGLFEQALLNKSFVAIGETGLDYCYYKDHSSIQKKYFHDAIEIAQNASLPLIIHCRDAFDDLLDILDNSKFSGDVILHCFTGSKKELYKLIDRNYYVSFSGIVTFKKAEGLSLLTKDVPIERLLIETDSPYLAPVPMRGKCNEPSFLRHTAEFIAKVRGVEISQLIQVTTANARRVFSI